MEIKEKITVAFGSVPKDSGTFTFYRNLRPALLEHGIDLKCVTVGKREARLIEKSYIDEGCILLAENINDIKKQSQIFVEWCSQEEVDIVMAINSIAILSALPHLPEKIKVISRCANGFDEGYQVTLAGKERLMKIVALTPKLKNDLINKYNTNPSLIELIPNGIDPIPFEENISPRLFSPDGSPIHLGFLGRLEHKQKGVFYVPKIVNELKSRNLSFKLSIAGKGVHRPILEKQLKPYIESGEVEFLGAISKNEVPKFLKSIDVFLFTSHFEGCPNSLLEAMMAGATPVSFLIEGITDFILQHEKTGFIAPMGDTKTFADYIALLSSNRQMLKAISRQTAMEARKKFTSKITAQKYAHLFQSIQETVAPVFDSLSWSDFKVVEVYRKKGIFTFLNQLHKLSENVSKNFWNGS